MKHEPELSRTRLNQFGFVISLVATILVLQLVTAAIAGVLARRDAVDATRDAFEFVGDATEERVLRFLEPAESVVESRVGEIAASPDTEVQLPESLYRSIYRLRQVNAVYIAYANGDFVSVRRTERGYAVLQVSSGAVRTVQLSLYDDLFRRQSGPIAAQAEDPRVRQWYQDTTDSDSVI